MKITSINVTMDDNTIKEYPVVDCVMIGVCKEGDQQVVMSQISENQSLQLNVIKAILNYIPQPTENTEDVDENNADTENSTSPA